MIKVYNVWAKKVLIKVYNVWGKKVQKSSEDGTEDWCKIWRKTDLYFQKWHEDLADFHRLRHSDFILESEMAKLNQNKNSKQLDRPDSVRKLWFTLEINE